MLTIEILCVGKMSQKWFADGFEEYRKRLTAFDTVRVTEIPEHRVSSDSEALRREAVEKEGEQILKVLREAKKAKAVALCVEGKQYSSEELASLIRETKQGCSRLIFVIGGSDGLSDAVKNACALRMSMSRMTFPHQMARMVLAEQLYRAETINSGMKYHK